MARFLGETAPALQFDSCIQSRAGLLEALAMLLVVKARGIHHGLNVWPLLLLPYLPLRLLLLLPLLSLLSVVPVLLS